jgi:membrane protease YdiL (CAAX protease family)
VAVAVLRSVDGRVRPGWRFVIAAVLAILAQLGAFTLVPPPSLISASAAVVFFVVLAIALAIFTVMSRTLDRATSPLAYIGFSRDVPVVRLIAVGFVFGAAMVALAVLVIVLGGSTTFRWRMNGAMLQAAGTQLLLFAIAGLLEEVAFRGYPFQRLIDSIGKVPAVVAFSVMFALPHLGNPNSSLFAAFNTAAVGAVLAAAYLFTRSLWLAWGIHWGWNFVLAVAFGLSVSGFDTDGPVDGSVAGPEWLTGGAYGIEGGASGSLAIVVGFAGLLWLVRQPALVGAPAPPPAAYVVVPGPVAIGEPEPPSSSSP